MKKTIKLAVVAALALGATSAFATNGDHMMALGAKSTSMGGVGVATAFGAQSSLANAALIKGNEVSFGGTLFMPAVEFKGEVVQPQANGAKYQKSDASLNMIPSVAFVQDVNDKFTWGLGMFGTAGMGVDYRDDVAMYNNGTGAPGGLENAYMGTMSGTNQLSTALMIMKFTLPMAYRPITGLSLGIAPVVQYGSLGMSYNNGAFTQGVARDNTGAPTGSYNYHNVRTGGGASDDLGFGYEIGLAYEVSGLTLGAVYKSAIDMEYTNQISEATANFGLSGYSDHLEQPAEMGLGLSYAISGSTIALDYKNIAWSSAKGYEDFKWKDQSVLAIGYEYKAKSFAIRLGYNHANNPIEEQAGAAGFGATGITNYEGAVLNYFNLAGFPAIIETHYTVGGTINLSDVTSIDLAYVYSPEVTQSFDTSAMSQGQYFNGDPTANPAAPFSSSANVKHSQSAVTFAANIAF
jgi:long-chain fatty acid transport protein